MNLVLVEAILRMRRVSFVYHGKPRLAEPQCYGLGHNDNELLRVYLVEGGGAQKEPLFSVREIQDLAIVDQRFANPGPNYTRNDSVMKTIFAQL